jgi:CMP-N,N'-diacetyllegionaminic acid synthase
MCEMKIAALLTGRGNNTLPNKNLLPINGIELCRYPAKAAAKIISSDNLFVSSDDQKILDAAKLEGYLPIKRPQNISGNKAQHIDAIMHGLSVIESQIGTIDILVVMLANSVTIKSRWIKEGIDIIKEDPSVSAVVPAYQEQDHHPYRARRLTKSGFLEPYFNFGDTNLSTNRQDLPANYFLSHNFWVLNKSKSLQSTSGWQPWNFMGEKVKPIKVTNCFDVHDLEDIKKSEKWLSE